MTCTLDEHICDPYVTYSIHATSPNQHAFRGARSGPISSAMGIPIYCFLKTFQLYYRDIVCNLLCTRVSMVALLRNTWFADLLTFFLSESPSRVAESPPLG